nr:immunoglobulin heavy chain junction region [Mus musculus]
CARTYYGSSSFDFW